MVSGQLLCSERLNLVFWKLLVLFNWQWIWLCITLWVRFVTEIVSQIPSTKESASNSTRGRRNLEENTDLMRIPIIHTTVPVVSQIPPIRLPLHLNVRWGTTAPNATYGPESFAAVESHGKCACDLTNGEALWKPGGQGLEATQGRGSATTTVHSCSHGVTQRREAVEGWSRYKWRPTEPRNAQRHCACGLKRWKEKDENDDWMKKKRK